jgi:hypothetical protein
MGRRALVGDASSMLISAVPFSPAGLTAMSRHECAELLLSVPVGRGRLAEVGDDQVDVACLRERIDEAHAQHGLVVELGGCDES